MYRWRCLDLISQIDQVKLFMLILQTSQTILSTRNHCMYQFKNQPNTIGPSISIDRIFASSSSSFILLMTNNQSKSKAHAKPAQVVCFHFKNLISLNRSLQVSYLQSQLGLIPRLFVQPTHSRPIDILLQFQIDSWAFFFVASLIGCNYCTIGPLPLWYKTFRDSFITATE